MLAKPQSALSQPLKAALLAMRPAAAVGMEDIE